MLESVLIQGDFQFQNMWDITIYDKIGGFLPVNFLIKSYTCERMKLEYAEIEGTGIKYFSGVTYPKEITITFFETTDWRVTNFLSSLWKRTFDDNTRTFRNYAMLPKMLGHLGEFNATLTYYHNELPTKKYNFKNMRLLSWSDLEGDYSNGDAMEITANFAFDELLDT